MEFASDEDAIGGLSSLLLLSLGRALLLCMSVSETVIPCVPSEPMILHLETKCIAIYILVSVLSVYDNISMCMSDPLP